MHIIDEIKPILTSPDVLEILAESVYMPTEDKLKSRADQYSNNENVVVFGYIEDDAVYGLIVLDTISKEKLVILNISVGKSHQHCGIGSKLVDHTLKCLNPKVLVAETDDDAVEFYRKYGFKVNNLGEKYPNVIRYECKYIFKN